MERTIPESLYQEIVEHLRATESLQFQDDPKLAAMSASISALELLKKMGEE
jgi:hypothetical protein